MLKAFTFHKFAKYRRSTFYYYHTITLEDSKYKD